MGSMAKPMLDSVTECPELASRLLARGKVRDIYDLGDGSLLFVATDRVSAFDVVMKTPVPDKGRLLTSISRFWFELLAPIAPNHLLTLHGKEDNNFNLPPSLEGRAMRVRKLKMLPIEAIVRGYLSGSAWKEYCVSGTVHGILMPSNMKQNQRFAEPIFTPSTKAEVGGHDENIHPDRAVQILGAELAEKVRRTALALFARASEYARGRGLILVDTKFEFGLSDGTLYLADEVLTPDSSRFWHAPDASQNVASIVGGIDSGGVVAALDKQFLRDYLMNEAVPPFNKECAGGVELPAHIVNGLRERYAAAERLLTEPGTISNKQ